MPPLPGMVPSATSPMPAPASIAVASTPLDPATSKILIVGAGTFGLSTAYYLQEDGFRDVTVLDRAAKLPARDAASTDINKIVRSSYGDRFYTRLGREAIAKWKDPMWEGCYHESGVLSIGDACVDELHENDLAEGAPVVVLPDAESIRSTFPPSLRIPTVTQATSRSLHNHLGSFADYNGYFNQEGGWVEAARAVEILLNVVMARGAKLEGGKEVVMLLRSNTNKSVHTYGVKCTDGSTYLADRVVIATGSWTASSFPGLQLDKKCLATGQSVATIQLSSEEAERYRECPVILDFGTGFYTFPPNKDNIIKVAVHGAGHTHMVASSVPGTPSENRVPRKISTPRTILSHPQGSDGLRVPRSALYVMRDHLKAIYPELAQKAWAETRMCWYTDSPDGNWMIGGFPGDSGLFLATSGSGHAFKFLPNVGRLVVNILQCKADTATVAKFAVDRDLSQATNRERVEKLVKELVLADLCTPEDMLPESI